MLSESNTGWQIHPERTCSKLRVTKNCTGHCSSWNWRLHQTVAPDCCIRQTQTKWWCWLLQSTRSISDDCVILCHLAYTWAQGGMSFMSQHLYQIGTCRQMMSQAWHCSEFSLLYGFCSGVSGSIEHCQVGIAQFFWYLQVQPACISQWLLPCLMKQCSRQIWWPCIRLKQPYVTWLPSNCVHREIARCMRIHRYRSLPDWLNMAHTDGLVVYCSSW